MLSTDKAAYPINAMGSSKALMEKVAIAKGRELGSNAKTTICCTRYGNVMAVDTAVEMVKEGDNGIPVPNYVDENVSTKVVKLIQSYTGVVNKMVWRKE